MTAVFALTDAPVSPLPDWLGRAGATVVGGWQLTDGLHPHGATWGCDAPSVVVVALLGAQAQAWAQALLARPAPAPRSPQLWLTDALPPATLARLVEAGWVHAWASPQAWGEAGPSAEALATLLDWARMQAAHAQRWQIQVHTLAESLQQAQAGQAQAESQLAQLRAQFEERKWVERAKGVLMQTRSGAGQALGEDEAFRLLRGAAMQTNLRMGQVSRAVFEQAQWADAINRAGQLRMLSQRLVKLAAQRLASIDARRARTLQHQAIQRAQDNVDHLAALPALGTNPTDTGLLSLWQSTQNAWAALKLALEDRQSPTRLAEMDTAAEALLRAAEAFTGALQTQGGRQSLHVINLCGRQRMLVQRLAKTALLADLLAQPARQDTLVPLLDEFEAALQELERLPLSSTEIRQRLAAAREEWLRLLRGLRGHSLSPGTSDPRAALAGSADALLELFDPLTAAYEHSLQVIMG